MFKCRIVTYRNIVKYTVRMVLQVKVCVVESDSTALPYFYGVVTMGVMRIVPIVVVRGCNGSIVSRAFASAIRD